MISNAEILSIVQIKIGNQVSIAESYLLSLIDEIEQEIKNYCNIKQIPKELKYVWANMVADYALRFSPDAIAAAKSSDDNAGESINSISLAGISVSLGSSNNTSIINDANKRTTIGIVEFMKEYKNKLQPFRRVRW